MSFLKFLWCCGFLSCSSCIMLCVSRSSSGVLCPGFICSFCGVVAFFMQFLYNAVCFSRSSPGVLCPSCLQFLYCCSLALFLYCCGLLAVRSCIVLCVSRSSSGMLCPFAVPVVLCMAFTLVVAVVLWPSCSSCSVVAHLVSKIRLQRTLVYLLIRQSHCAFN